MPLCIAQIEGCDLQHRQHSVYFKASKYYSDTLECKNVMLFSVTKKDEYDQTCGMQSAS